MSLRRLLQSLLVGALVLVVAGLGVWVLDLVAGSDADAGRLAPIALQSTRSLDLPRAGTPAVTAPPSSAGAGATPAPSTSSAGAGATPPNHEKVEVPVHIRVSKHATMAPSTSATTAPPPTVQTTTPSMRDSDHVTAPNHQQPTTMGTDHPAAATSPTQGSPTREGHDGGAAAGGSTSRDDHEGGMSGGGERHR